MKVEKRTCSGEESMHVAEIDAEKPRPVNEVLFVTGEAIQGPDTDEVPVVHQQLKVPDQGMVPNDILSNNVVSGMQTTCHTNVQLQTSVIRIVEILVGLSDMVVTRVVVLVIWPEQVFLGLHLVLYLVWQVVGSIQEQSYSCQES